MVQAGSHEKSLALVTITLICVLAVYLGGCSTNTETPAPVNTPNSTPDTAGASSPTPDRSNAFQLNHRLGKGINLGNALEAPREGEWGLTLQEEYFDLIKGAGFDVVRIPIRWSAQAAQNEPYTIAPSFFERVDWAIDQALSRDLLAVINMHHYEEIMQDPEGHEQRFLALWEQIASRYQDYPQEELVFELLNEPNTALGPSSWNRLLAKAVDVVRKTNPNRTIVVGPTSWNNIGQLRFLELPDDDNIIVTVHYYDPFQFTHQGAEWVSESEPWLGKTWEGTSSQEQAVIKDLEKAASWAEKHNRPIFLGEFGAYSKADMDSRARWTDFVARQAEERDMSWAYWEFGAGFGAYDRSKQRWNRPILDALLAHE